MKQKIQLIDEFIVSNFFIPAFRVLLTCVWIVRYVSPYTVTR